MPHRSRQLAILLALLLEQLCATSAWAGPPFVTDDPEPTEPGHWEVYGFAEGSHVPGITEEQAGFDINYGAAKDLQLTAVVPVDFVQDGRHRAGVGDVEIAAKYLFLHQHDGSVLPDVAFFPGLTAPTARRTFGSGRVSFFLPVWAQKDVGPWSIFGGGGYAINPGRDQRDFWLEGIALSRTITERLSLGAEIYHQGAAARDERRFTGINVGATYRLSPHWSVLASGGPGLQHSRAQGQYDGYVSLKLDY